MTNTPTRPETMVERVARAIHDASHKELGFSWAKEMRMAQARAAIEAMREPTGEMLEAGWERARPYLGLETTKQTYRAMINAALGEGK